MHPSKAAPPWHAALRILVLVVASLAVLPCARDARGATFPLGAVASIDLPPSATVRPAGANELAGLRAARRAPRLLFAGSIEGTSGPRIGYEFHRCGRLPDPKGVLDPRAIAAVARTPGFAGWRVLPAWSATRHALFWSYDVVSTGMPRTLTFAAFCTREGVLVLERTSVPGRIGAGEPRAWFEFTSRVTIAPGRRYEDAAPGEPLAAERVESLIVGRGVPGPAGAWPSPRSTGPGPAWVALRGGAGPGRIASATALAMLLAWLLARSWRAFARLGVDISGPVAPASGAAASAEGDATSGALPPGGLAQKISLHVESLARALEPGALVLGAEGSGTLALSVAIDYAVRFTTRTTEGTGRLGAHVQRCDSAGAFDAALGQLLSRTSAESEGRLDAWIAANRADYRARLAESDVRSAPQWVGFSWTCGTCSGRGRVTCHGCGGRRTLTCTMCGGGGSTTCSNCGGSSQTSCSGCGGSGYRWEQVSVSGWDSATNSNVTRWESRQVRCASCGGQGRLHCTSCTGGRRQCGGCFGSGTVQCGTCGGSGDLACGTCGATGTLHRAGVVDCRIEGGVTIEVPDGIPEDAETMRTRVAFESLGHLGDLRFHEGERRGRSAHLAYRAAVALRTLEVVARDRPVSLRAYGGHGAVFHHHDLVETLLEPDVRELEAALGALPWWKRTGTSALLERLRVFFSSELHVRLVEAKSGMPEAEAEIVRVRATGLASEAYAARATLLADRSLGRLQSSSIEQAAIAWCAALALLFLVNRLLAFGALPAATFTLAVVALAVPAWFALEWVTRGRLRRMLTRELESRVAGRLGAARMRHRAVVAAFGVVAWLLASLPDRL